MNGHRAGNRFLWIGLGLFCAALAFIVAVSSWIN